MSMNGDRIAEAAAQAAQQGAPPSNAITYVPPAPGSQQGNIMVRGEVGQDGEPYIRIYNLTNAGIAILDLNVKPREGQAQPLADAIPKAIQTEAAKIRAGLWTPD